MLSETVTGQGISAANRRRLAMLLADSAGPFGVRDAARTLDVDPTAARRFLAYLAARGWLTRVRQGLYERVPLEATNPAGWPVNAWVKAHRVFAPCYIGGFSACSHWALTDQLFRTVVVITSRWTRKRETKIQNTEYLVKVVSPKRMFGTLRQWADDLQVEVSDPARTLVDMLDDPRLGGGMRQVADTVDRFFFFGDLRNDELLLEYVERFGNRSIYKRLGYVVEKLGIDAPDVLEACARRMSQGTVRLDPSGSGLERPLKRWGLIVNSTVIRQTP